MVYVGNRLLVWKSFRIIVEYTCAYCNMLNPIQKNTTEVVEH